MAAAPRRPPGPPTLTDPDRLRKVAWLAGLAVAGIDAVTCTFDYPDDDAVLGPVLASGIGRAAARAGGARRGGQGGARARCGPTGRRGAGTGWRTCSGCWWRTRRNRAVVPLCKQGHLPDDEVTARWLS